MDRGCVPKVSLIQRFPDSRGEHLHPSTNRDAANTENA